MLANPDVVFEIVSATAARLLPTESAQAYSSRTEQRHVLISRLDEALGSIEEVQTSLKKGECEIQAAVVYADGQQVSVPVSLVADKEWQALLSHLCKSLSVSIF